MEWLNRLYFNNSIQHYCLVFGSIFLVMVLRKLLSKYIAALLCACIQRIGGKVERKSFIALVFKPLSWLIVVLISILLIDKLNFPEVLNITIYGITTQQITEKTGIIIILFFITRFMIQMTDFIALFLKQKAGATSEKGDDQLIVFFRDFLKVIISIVGLLLIIKAGFNQNIGTLLTGLSIVGAALALAAKESLENLIASFIIFFDKPFFIGDTLKVHNITGTVEGIGLRSTRIRTQEKTLVTVPNKQMVDSVVDNWSMRNNYRTEVKLEFSNQSNTASIVAFMEEVKKLLADNVLINSSTVQLSDLNKNSIVISIEYLTEPIHNDEFNIHKSNIHLKLKKIMDNYAFDTVALPGELIMKKVL